ncbi:MAG: hemolysin family protein [Culicoidibacterales bacterium]
MDVDPESTNLIIQFVLIFILTLVNAFFSSAEMAIISTNRNKIKTLAEDGQKNAIVLEKLLADPTSFLSTIQVGITFAGFFSSASAATSLSGVFGGYLSSFGIPYGESIALVGVTIALSYITLVFGELLPKRIALQNSEKVALMSAKPIAYTLSLLSPFVKFLTLSTNVFVRLLGFSSQDLDEKVSREEIKSLIEVGQSHGVINDVEKEMMHNIFDFDEMSAREIMTPRPNVYAIDINEPFSEYIDELITNQYSRVPVYDEEIDNIIGILYIKDILIAARKVGFEQIDVRALLQQALFVPERKKIDELFKELQAQKKHMAILVDEYGGFSGIVTLEDLIEEVMGEIEDEYDEDLVPIRKINETTYILDGLVPVHEVVEELELQLPTDSPDFDTISGFLVHLLGYIPQENSTEVIEYNNLIFTIKKIVDKRIATVELQINQIEK